MKLTEFTALASEHSQPDSLDVSEVTLKPTLFDSLALFTRLNIRLKKMSYIYTRNFRLCLSVGTPNV